MYERQDLKNANVYAYAWEWGVSGWTYKLARKEGNILFNDTLNTFYLRFYGVRYGKGPFR